MEGRRERILGPEFWVGDFSGYMRSDPLGGALYEHQEESAVIDTPLQRASMRVSRLLRPLEIFSILSGRSGPRQPGRTLRAIWKAGELLPLPCQAEQRPLGLRVLCVTF